MDEVHSIFNQRISSLLLKCYFLLKEIDTQALNKKIPLSLPQIIMSWNNEIASKFKFLTSIADPSTMEEQISYLQIMEMFIENARTIFSFYKLQQGGIQALQDTPDNELSGMVASWMKDCRVLVELIMQNSEVLVTKVSASRTCSKIFNTPQKVEPVTPRKSHCSLDDFAMIVTQMETKM